MKTIVIETNCSSCEALIIKMLEDIKDNITSTHDPIKYTVKND